MAHKRQRHQIISFIKLAILCPSVERVLWATQLLSKKCRRGGKPLATMCSNLTGLSVEYQISRSRDELVTARPTGLFVKNITIKLVIFLLDRDFGFIYCIFDYTRHNQHNWIDRKCHCFAASLSYKGI